MKIVVRLLPNDQWFEFTFAPDATFAQIKIPVLRHWGILPGLSLLEQKSRGDPSSFTSHLPSPARAGSPSPLQTQHAATSGITGGTDSDGDHEHAGRASLASSTSSTSFSHVQHHYQPHTELIHECARIMASYSFKSVCCGCFLSEDAVLSKWCVEYDLLVIQPRATSISINPKNFQQAVLRLHCLVAFPKSINSSLDSHSPEEFISLKKKQPFMSNRPSTASAISNSALRSLSTDSKIRSNRIFTSVRLQVHGERLWLHRVARDGSSEYGEDYLKSYALPAIISTVIDSTVDGRALKLGFLSGDILLVKARNEGDWLTLNRCLGPAGTASNSDDNVAEIGWRTRMHDRAAKSSLDLLPRPSLDRSTTPSSYTKIHSSSSSSRPKPRVSEFPVGVHNLDGCRHITCSFSGSRSANIAGTEGIRETATHSNPAVIREENPSISHNSPVHHEPSSYSYRAENASNPTVSLGYYRQTGRHRTGEVDSDEDQDTQSMVMLPLIDASEASTPLSAQADRFVLDLAQIPKALESHRFQSRSSNGSSFEAQSLSVGWSSGTTSPLPDDRRDPGGKLRGTRLLARDDRRINLRGEDDLPVRRFFGDTEADQHSCNSQCGSD